MNDNIYGIFTALFRAQMLLHFTSMTAAYEDSTSDTVLAEIAAAADAVNRAISRHMADHGIDPAELQPLADSITAEMLADHPEGGNA